MRCGELRGGEQKEQKRDAQRHREKERERERERERGREPGGGHLRDYPKKTFTGVSGIRRYPGLNNLQN